MNKKTAGIFVFLLALTGCMVDPGLPAGPSVTVTSPASGDTVLGPILSVTGSASDGYGLEGVYADLDSNGFSKVTGTMVWSTNYRNIADGSHTVKIFSKALSGLTSQTNTLIIWVTNGSVTNTNNWTVMIYLDGDNNLEYWAYVDFNEMERGLLNAINSGSRDLMSNLSVIVMFDRYTTGGYIPFVTDNGGGWADTRLYRVLPDADSTYFASERLDDGTSIPHHIPNLGEKNVGDTNTLKEFIGYVVTNYPARNYALVFWDHGAGVEYMCVDDTSADKLYIDEIRQAVGTYLTNTNLQMIGFDACYMSTVEVAYEFKDLSRYFVGSMYKEDQWGWDYTGFFGGMTGSKDPKNLSGADISGLVVSSFSDYFQIYTDDWGHTLSAIDLSKMNNLKSKIDLFASALYAEGKKSDIETVRDSSVHFYNTDNGSVEIPYFDVYDLCQKIIDDTSHSFSFTLKNSAQDVIDALAAAVVLAYGNPCTSRNQLYYYGDGNTVKRGLSLFFSRGNLTFTDDGYHPLKVASGAQSHFWFQWWYTSTNVSDWWSGHYYGNLDFCDSDLNGTVNTWRELLKAWYDPYTNVNTPGSY